MRVLILDNFDSFVYNLADYVGKLGADPIVVRSGKIDLKGIEELSPDRIILSPGPGHPSEKRYAGVCEDAVLQFSRNIPILGVCLGHQIIVHAFGGRIVRARRIIHGKASIIQHIGRGIFRGIENPIKAGRYHSLVADEAGLPSCFEVIARSVEDGEIMGVRHRKLPIIGLQFHPESILTVDGIKLLKNFLEGEL
ncbi:MAG TPA: aminodeoxychorismate/anthranilate synthase component II [Nitrososphaeria archaeon]|nr:MAG: aminodeoxychorismate/anthranilate synthase component II [Nitrososphaerota archaeon]HDD42733.1 aminodeoxychorismate/anthranilate synthase component II [Nitrososphaeria archaeon]